MATKDIKIIIETLLKDEQFKKQLAGMAKGFGKTEEKASKFKKVLMGAFGTIAGVMGIRMVINAFRKLIGVTSQFEQAIANVASVSGGTTRELTKLARAAGKQGLGFTAKESADAMYFLASAGLATEDMAKVLTPTLRLAAAAQMDIANATDIVVNQLKVYGGDMRKAGKFTDIMAKTVASSNTNMQQLGDALNYASSVASVAGVSFETLNAMIAAMADLGIKGGKAGVQLRMAIVRLMKPTEQAADILKNKYNLAVEDLQAMLQEGNIVGVLEQLKTANIDIADSLELFGVRQSTVIKLINDGIPRVKELSKTISEAGGTAEQMARVQLDTLNGSMKKLNAAWQDFVIRNTARFLPGMKKIVDATTDLVKEDDNLIDVTNELVKSNREYAKITKTLADESADLTDRERAKLEVRKAELKLKIIDSIKLTNKLYKEQTKKVPELQKKIEQLNTIYINQAKTVKGLSDGTIEASHIFVQQYGKRKGATVQLDRAMKSFEITQRLLAVSELELQKRSSEYDEAVRTLAIGLKNELISKTDLIKVDKKLIAEAVELAKKIRLVGDEYVETADDATGATKKWSISFGDLTVTSADFFTMLKEQLKQVPATIVNIGETVGGEFGRIISGMGELVEAAMNGILGLVNYTLDKIQETRAAQEQAIMDVMELDQRIASQRVQNLEAALDAELAAYEKNFGAVTGREEEFEKGRLAILDAHNAAIKEAKLAEFEINKRMALIQLEISRAEAEANMRKSFGLFVSEKEKAAWRNMQGKFNALRDLIMAQTPAFQSGTPSVQDDTMARVHKGERIIPAGMNLEGVSNADLIGHALQGMQMGGAYTNTTTNAQKYITISGDINVNNPSSADDIISQLEELAEDTGREFMPR